LIDALTLNEKIAKSHEVQIEQLLAHNLTALSGNEVLKILTYVSRIRGVDLPKITQIINAQVKDLKLENLTLDELSKNLLFLGDILKFSNAFGRQLMQYVMENPNLMNDKTLTSILRKFDPKNYPSYFIKFLNKTVSDHMSKDTFSLPTLAAFCFHLARAKQLDLELFKKIESRVVNSLKCEFTTMDVHHLLWTCSKLTFYNSPLYGKMVETVRKILNDKPLEPKTLSILLWDTSQGSTPYDIDYYLLWIKHLSENPKLFSSSDTQNISFISTILYSLGILHTKYILADQQVYNETYKELIRPYMQKLTDVFHKAYQVWTTKDPNFFHTLENPVKTQLLQFLSLLQHEYPELVDKNIDIYEKMEDYAKSIKYDLKQSNLNVDIGADLDKMGVKHKKEARIFVYFIDFLLEPNIVLEIDGVKHYSRGSQDMRSRDALKMYHLKKMGYKVAVVPYFEYSRFFFTEYEKKKEYLQNKILKAE